MLFYLIVAVCAAAIVLILLVLPGESSAEQRAPFWGLNVAHRGLHSKDKSVPENSLAAFTAAVDAGYGIELDLQLTADGEVVVFHDDDLKRVCGVEGRLDSYTLKELQAFRLHGTDQGIPTLQQMLDVVDGQVPLVIELKTSRRHKQLCQTAWRILRRYDGDICIESFDPRIVWRFKRYVPGVLRGQLAARPKNLGISGIARYVVGWGLCHFMGRPHFIAYQKGKRPPLIRLAQRFCMRVAWTARPEDDTEKLEAENDCVIFEYYTPQVYFDGEPDRPQSWPEDEEFRF